MKFGHNLPLNQVPEWSDSYIDYKFLKGLIKRAANATADGVSPSATSTKSGSASPKTLEGANPGESDESQQAKRDDCITEFFYALDRNADIVETFFCIKFAEYSRRLNLITSKYALDPKLANLIDSDELVDIVGLLLELRGKLRKLQWYAEVNRQGFFKILKKYDRHVGLHSKSRYFSSKVMVLSFSNADAVSELVALANKYLDVLAPEIQQQPKSQSHAATSMSAPISPRSSSTALNKPAPKDGLMTTEPELAAAVDADDGEQLQASLNTRKPGQKLLLKLLMRALAKKLHNSTQCLLSNCPNLQDLEDIDKRNVIHQLIIRAGREHCERDVLSDSRKFYSGDSRRGSLTISCDELDIPGQAELTLEFLFASLPESHHFFVAQPDQLLRTPLHYAARYGLVRIAKLLLGYYQKWDLIDIKSKSGLFGVEWLDSEKESPLSLAIDGRHPRTARVLLETGAPHTETVVKLLNPLLLKAVRLDSKELVEVLLDFGLNIDYQDPRTGETALYLSTKFQCTAVARILLERKADVNIAESTFGWSPLFVAAVDGHKELAQMLLDFGSPGDPRDLSGWTPKEHAVLRGHLELASIFPAAPLPDKETDWTNIASATDVNSTEAPSVESAALASAKKTMEQKSSTRKGSATTTQEGLVKTFGHGYLADPEKSLLIISLGSKNIRCKTAPVEMEKVPFSKAGVSALDSALSLRISAPGCGGVEPVIDILSTENELALEPFFFTTSNPDSIQIYFDLVPRYKPGEKPLGRAVALVSSIVKSVGLSRANLDTALTIPLLEVDTLKVIGSVTFEFMIVTPFSHPNACVAKSSTYWRSLITTRLIGHRGLGKNTTSRNSLQLGENTIESFIQAANLGASYVEFDVQLTRDLVPVIYHDFIVGDSGFDIPMHELTLEQFMNIHSPHHHKGRRNSHSYPKPARPGRTQSMVHLSRRSRASSEPASDHELSDEDEESDARGMKLTRDFKSKGYKGNVRGHSIQSKFATLEELFRTLPAGVGFNIECKYPMVDECEAEGLETVGINLNQWVDVVLKCVYDHKGSRDIVFSSFHPDICALLSLKQPSIPVLFLTEGGTAPMMDVRASSLQEAIRFSRCWNLLGIVSEATPLIECPRLVGVIKNSGLVCFTYGTANNEPSNARRQLKAGVDAVIVDSVLRVRKDLTDETKVSDPEASSFITAYSEEMGDVVQGI